MKYRPDAQQKKVPGVPRIPNSKRAPFRRRPSAGAPMPKNASTSSSPFSVPVFPMRINKYLAWKQFSTRRGADDLITRHLVFINGHRAELGSKVTEKDIIDVRVGKKPKQYVYLAYNKPRGVITHSPQEGEKDIKKAISLKKEFEDVFPVGRLDKDSHGLIILTNDGRITDKLLNPEYAHEKEYVVTTKNKLRASFREKMEKGVNIGEYTTKPCKVQIINDYTFRITLTEGKKHQIRRMCDALFQEVDDLKRTKIMNINLGHMDSGSYRKLEEKELASFMKELGF